MSPFGRGGWRSRARARKARLLASSGASSDVFEAERRRTLTSTLFDTDRHAHHIMLASFNLSVLKRPDDGACPYWSVGTGRGDYDESSFDLQGDGEPYRPSAQLGQAHRMNGEPGRWCCGVASATPRCRFEFESQLVPANAWSGSDTVVAQPQRPRTVM